MNTEQTKNKNFNTNCKGLFVVLGSGESGIGTALLAKKVGYNVWVSDAGIIKEKYKNELIAANIDFEEGGHNEAKILQAVEVMKSPGIPYTIAIVQSIIKAKIPIISEFELAYRHKGNSKIVAITGTNGKSTTTSLTYHIFKTAGLSCALVGNIGYSIARQIATSPVQWYVAEVSSYQLDDTTDFRPDVAVLLNITPDHLDRYQHKFENYVNSKFSIIKNQTANDYFIYNADDEVIVQHLELLTTNTNTIPFSMNKELKKGAHIKGDNMMMRVHEERVSMSVNDFVLKGRHNMLNTMAACVAADTVGIRKEKIRESVSSYNGLPHRMEFVATVRGVDFINDSKATNVNSTWYALEGMKKPTVLILGGKIKDGTDFSILNDLVKEKVKAIVCLGADNTLIKKAFKGIAPVIVETNTAKDCAEACFKLAAKGDVVLLSPACASFDLFADFNERGNQFKEAVLNL